MSSSWPHDRDEFQEQPSASAEVDALKALSAECANRARPARSKIYPALDRAFAKLVLLEAELKRIEEPHGAAEDPEVKRLVAELRDLRWALADLRSKGVTPSPLAHGFVVPRRHRR